MRSPREAGEWYELPELTVPTVIAVHAGCASGYKYPADEEGHLQGAVSHVDRGDHAGKGVVEIDSCQRNGGEAAQYNRGPNVGFDKSVHGQANCNRDEQGGNGLHQPYIGFGTGYRHEAFDMEKSPQRGDEGICALHGNE